MASPATFYAFAPPEHLRQGRLAYTVEEAEPTPAAVQALCIRRTAEANPGSDPAAPFDGMACAVTRRGEPALIILPAIRDTCPLLYFTMLAHELGHAMAAEIGEDASAHINWPSQPLPPCPTYQPPRKATP